MEAQAQYLHALRTRYGSLGTLRNLLCRVPFVAGLSGLQWAGAADPNLLLQTGSTWRQCGALRPGAFVYGTCCTLAQVLQSPACPTWRRQLGMCFGPARSSRVLLHSGWRGHTPDAGAGHTDHNLPTYLPTYLKKKKKQGLPYPAVPHGITPTSKQGTLPTAACHPPDAPLSPAESGRLGTGPRLPAYPRWPP